eukprot:SAG22_NODE_16_length_32723_cov_26.404825_3_plen_38_part_00
MYLDTKPVPLAIPPPPPSGTPLCTGKVRGARARARVV